MPRPKRNRVKRALRIRTRTRGARVHRPRIAPAGTHHFKRVCNITNPVSTNLATAVSVGTFTYTDDSWTLGSGVAGGNKNYFSFSTMFTLDMLPNYTEFTVLFDQYKINGVRLTITPFSSDSPVQLATVGGNSNQSVSGFLHSITDYDDNTPVAASVAGINAMRQYESYRCSRLFKHGAVMSRYIRPHIAQSAYGASVFTSFQNSGPKWIDSNSPLVEHYGVKGVFEVFEPVTGLNPFYWFKVEATLYMSFKNPR